MYELTERIADAVQTRGLHVTVSTACSSSSGAVGLARDLLVGGAADVLLAGGTDVLTPELFAAFHALGVLGNAPSAPFSLPEGMTLGEGAGFVVLERVEHARRRGAVPVAFLLGYGLAADAYHPTTPDPTGSGVARALRSALRDARVRADEVGYVNAHATGTAANDPAEWAGISSVLGGGVPVSGSKSFLGHAQGAAGALELIVTLLGLRAQRLPPTIHATTPRRNSPPDIVTVPRAHAFSVAASLSSAFSGANSALIAGSSPRNRAQERRPLFVHGASSFVGAIDDVEALACAIEKGDAIARRVQVALKKLLPMADTRGMDPSTRMLAAACAKAARDAGLRGTGAARDATGLVAAVSSYSTDSAAEFRRSVAERGLVNLNTTAFAKLVLSAPTGEAAKLLSLRGATTTLTMRRGGGAVAVAYSAELLSHDSGTDTILAGAVDELPGTGDETREGAAVLVLGAAPSPVRLAGWALRMSAEDALAAALAQAGLVSVELALSERSFAVLGEIPAAGSGIACAIAYARVRSGRAPSASVVADGGGIAAALVFTR